MTATVAPAVRARAGASATGEADEIEPTPAPAAASEPAVADEPTILAQAGAENFPVASRLLPRRQRSHLLAVYGVARLIDDIGDESTGDRLAELEWAAEELGRAYTGGARSAVFGALEASLAEVNLPRQAFAELIEANRQDQVVTRYQRYEDLLGYCALSANPVGRLVLTVFGRASEDLFAWSDSVCSGLQLVEHWQDVAEDAGQGRIYLPLEDLARFGVAEDELVSGAATPAFRRLMAFESARARRLLLFGAPLVRALRGRPRVAVAGFVAGGLAALDAIEAAGYDVLSADPRPRPGQVLRTTLKLVAGGAR